MKWAMHNTGVNVWPGSLLLESSDKNLRIVVSQISPMLAASRQEVEVKVSIEVPKEAGKYETEL